MTTPLAGHSECDEFFVGYLPTPQRLRRFLRRILPALLTATLLIAALTSSGQADPGAGRWDTTATVTLEGVLLTAPYPMLRVATADGRGVETVFLVESGKRGSSRAAQFSGQPVRATGYLLQRGVRRMLELAETPGALAPTSGMAPATVAFILGTSVVPLGPWTLRGEIVDSKCFLGAMKPGEGKPHKECATLCIAGGVPPLLMTRDAAGRHALYLIVDPSGSAPGAALLLLVADPVEVTGELQAWGDITLLIASPHAFRRL